MPLSSKFHQESTGNKL